MINFTHTRIARKAHCTQWDGTNSAEIVAKFEDARLHGSDSIIVFTRDETVTLTIGWWIVVGEDDLVRCYSDQEFSLMYKRIPSWQIV